MYLDMVSQTVSCCNGAPKLTFYKRNWNAPSLEVDLKATLCFLH